VVRCAGGDCAGASAAFADVPATGHTCAAWGGLEQERCIELEMEV